MTDPAEVEAAAEEAKAELRKIVAMAAGFWEDLRAAGLPDEVANQMVIDWHWQTLIWVDE